ncbi:MAG TPA: LD-carboxypeptidase [Desulfobacteraceae bacterium]|nr:LD-carboxypeptidase [Desulfobacteraceae bacterium]HPJ66950.1 LD-carboxypeptidase [Desulfobacteraceae bacterium]HPQ27686.1 LD-carboxypeptidase [Desulfobacteraceae bacterium]
MKNALTLVLGVKDIKQQTFIKPVRLRPGDLIGVISPSSPVSRHNIQLSIKLLENSGFRVRLGRHVYDRQDYLAGNDEDRLADLHEMFLDPEIKAIFCSRGGYGSLRILDKIHFDLIKANPKIIVGYSDITALLIAIQKMTGLITFHGPVIEKLAHAHKNNWEILTQLLTSDNYYQKIEFSEGRILYPGKAVGHLIGGNLSLISHLIGTPYLPSFEGCLLFLEEKGEPLYRIDRMLTHLKLSGQLSGLTGIMAGEFYECGEMDAINRLLMHIANDLHIPVASGLPVGHGPMNITLPLGVKAELDTNYMTLEIQEVCMES